MSSQPETERQQPLTIQLNIGGMSCVHCQEKIESALSAAEGVESARVSFRSGRAEITYAPDRITADDIGKIIEEQGYHVVNGDKLRRAAVYSLITLAVIILLYFVLQFFGVLNYLAPSTLADSTMGFGMLFVIGLITSVHCVAMCGGINLSQCIPRETEEKRTGWKTFLPSLLYNAGRVISYTLIGLILGTVGWAIGGGGEVGIPAIIQGVLKIVAGVLMIVMGVNMLGLIPALRKLNPTLPKFLAKKIGREKARNTRPFIVGILNGVMPCGPLQSMWLVALATGDPFSGALSMLLFSLGTVPLMLGLGSIVAKLGQKFAKAVMTGGSVLVVVLGLAMLSQGGSLTGFLSANTLSIVILTAICVGVLFSLPIAGRTLKIVTRSVASVLIVALGAALVYKDNFSVAGDFDIAVDGGDVQTVSSVLDSGKYPNIQVKSGTPVVWTIDAPEGSINGCNYKVMIEEYGIEYTFHLGENVIEFTPTEKGVFSYSCWMGMIYATIVVV